MKQDLTAAEALARTLPQFSSFIRTKSPQTSMAGHFLLEKDAPRYELISEASASIPGVHRESKGTCLLAALMCAADVTEMARDSFAGWPGDHLARWNPVMTPRIVRFCPACLRAGRPFHQHWLLEAYVACPDHKCLLHELAPAGNEVEDRFGDKNPFTWRGFWKQPQAVELARKLESRPADEGVLTFARHIEALACEASNPESTYAADFKRLGLRDALLLARFIGRIGEPSFGSHSLRRLWSRRIAISMSAVQGAHEALADWPDGFNVYLEKIKRSIDGIGVAPTLARTYGSFTTYLFKHFGGSQFQFVRKAFVDHVIKEHPSLFDQRHRRFVALGDTATSNYTSATRAAKTLGVSPQVLIEFIRHDVIPGHVLNTNGLARARVLIPRGQLPLIAERLRSSMTVSQARQELRTSRVYFEAIVLAGLIDRPSRRDMQRGLVLRSQVESFHVRLSTAVLSEEPPQDAVPLSQVSAAVGKVAFPRLLRDVFDGRLRIWRGSGASSTEMRFPGDLLVSASEASRWRSADIATRCRGRVTVQQLAPLLKEKEEVLYHLVRTGLIPSVQARVGFREEALIVPEDGLRFLEEHASTRTLGLPTSTAYVMRYLRSQGIEPVTGPDVDGGRKYFFEKSEQLKVAVASFVPKRKMKNQNPFSEVTNEEGRARPF